MKNKYTYTGLLLAVLAAGAITGCSDDSATALHELQSPEVTIDEQSYNSLSFSWQSVDNAIQYGYVLTNPEGTVVGEGATVYNTATFTGLMAGTEYTLSVWAFASTQGDYSTSPAFILSATTTPLKAIADPQPQWTQSANRVTVWWDAVAHASSYEYVVTGPGIDDPETVETTATTVSLSGLETGVYEMTIYAKSTATGYEPKSPGITIAIAVEEVLNWSVRGTVAYGYYESDITYPATLSYDNATGIYTLERWCDVDGYGFSFTIGDDGMEVIGTVDSYGYCKVYTGLADPAYLNVYANSDYTTYEGDQEAGEIWICYYLPDWSAYDYMVFTW